MKIRDVEVFQVQWAPEDKPAQRSAWVRVQCDDGPCGIGEASPMQGGLASLGIVKHNLAPALIGKDPLDHAVLLDTLLHTFVKLGPEGALTGALAALDIALWDLKGKLFNQPIYAGGGKDPLRQRPHQTGHRHSRRYRQGSRGAAPGRG